MTILFTNNASTSLASGITSGATSLTVATGQGALFPTITGSNIFYLTLQNQAGTTPIEIVKVTARSGDTMTIVRGQDNTTASAFNAGDKVELRLPAVVLQDFPQLDVSNTFTVDQSISGLTVGKGGGAVSTNTAVGASALAANTTGANNTSLGYQALQTNSTGNYFTAVGSLALANATGGYLTAVGYKAGYSSTSASDLTAVGYFALQANTTGNENTGLGVQALQTNTTGSNNTAVGVQTLNNNTTASNNTAVGYQAGYSGTTAYSNVFVGRQAGYSQSVNPYSTFVGDQAGYNSTAAANTFIGAGAGQAVTSGAKNTILGGFSGNQGGLDIRTASNYIVLSDGDGNPRGYFNDVGRFFVTGSVNNDNVTYIVNSNATPSGLGIGFSGAAPNNTTQYAIQFGDTSSYRFRVWSNGNVVNSNNSYGSISDVKLKENIVDATPKLNKLMDVKVRNYNLIGETTKQIGVVAQELETIFPSMIDVSPDLDEEGNDLGTTTKSVKYSVFVPMLIKAIQELKAEVDELKASK